MSSVGPLQVAVHAALVADGLLVATIGADGVYSAVPSSDATLPYIVLGSATEVDFWTLGKGGNDGSLQISAYSAYMDNMEIADLYGHLHRILDRKPLALSGGKTVTYGRLTLLTTGPDESGAAMRSVALYRTHSR